LFPPAALPMTACVNNFSDYQRSEHAWMLNRFVVPILQLEPFLGAFEQPPASPETEAPWKLSAIVGLEPESDIDKAVDFNQRIFPRDKAVVIQSLEMKASDPETVRRLAP